jgi:vacuolar iron transporter family protein
VSISPSGASAQGKPRTFAKTRLGRAVDATSTASRASAPRHEPHTEQTNWLRDVILGGQDGLVNILGIELGVVAAGGSTSILITTGLAAAITESISMGAVAYTSSISERDYYLAQQAREKQEIETVPEQEREEIRDIYALKGFQGELLDAVVTTITANRETWLSSMMDEELHLERVETPVILRSAAVVTIATLIGHLIPLIPFFIFARTPAVIAAIVVSGLVLFGVGAYSAITLVGNWRTMGLKMLTIGLGAAALGFLIGRLFHSSGG